MTRLWIPIARLRAAWGAVLVAGVVAAGARWVEGWRPLPPERLATELFRVTSAADNGPGSLREAVFAADKVSGRARILIDVPRVVLESPLPPLVNPFGVVLEAGPRVTPELDATAIAGAALDVASPGTVISGLQITGGRAALVVRAHGTQLRNLRVASSGTGVLVGDGGKGDLFPAFADGEAAIVEKAAGTRLGEADQRHVVHRRLAAIGDQGHKGVELGVRCLQRLRDRFR